NSALISGGMRGHASAPPHDLETSTNPGGIRHPDRRTEISSSVDRTARFFRSRNSSVRDPGHAIGALPSPDPREAAVSRIRICFGVLVATCLALALTSGLTSAQAPYAIAQWPIDGYLPSIAVSSTGDAYVYSMNTGNG